MAINLYILCNTVSLKASGGIFEIEDPLANNTNNITLGPAANDLFTFAYVCINGLAGIGVMTSVIAFSINAFKFAKANSRERADSIQNLLTISITTACLGSIPMILYLVTLIMNY